MQGVYRSVLFALLLGVLPAAGGAAFAQSPGAFARLGFGARGIAMGNALVADVTGESSPYYNPALAPFSSGQNLSATAALLRFDRQLQFLQFATPMRPRAGIAFGLLHAGVSNIDGRNSSGFHTGDLSTDEFGFFLAFGTRIGTRLSAGIGLQLFRADIFDGVKPANTIGFDLGLTARLTESLTLGFTVDDLLARYSWDTSDVLGSDGRSTTDRFPVRYRLGGSYTLLEGRARIVAEYESMVTTSELRARRVVISGDTPREIFETEDRSVHDSRFRVGGEYFFTDAFAARAGLDRIGDDGLNGSRPSAGLMFEQPVGSLVARAEYTFVVEPYAVGTMHFITLRVFL